MTPKNLQKRLESVRDKLLKCKQGDALKVLDAIIKEIPREPKRGDIVRVDDADYGDVLVLEVNDNGFIGVDLDDNESYGMPCRDIVEILRETEL